MKQRINAALFVVFAFVLVSGLNGEASTVTASLAYTVAAGVVVPETETAALALTGWAEEQGGYFVVRSLEAVSLRVPPQALPELRRRLELLSTQIVFYNPAASDIRQDLRNVEVGITSREEAIEAILSFLETADIRGTLAFEREMMEILLEIERLEGRRIELLHRAAFARIDVSLIGSAQQLPVDIPSSFGWINTLGLERFLREVR